MTTKEKVMPLIGIIAKKREIQSIKKCIKESSIEIIGITKDALKNVKNIVFEEIIIYTSFLALWPVFHMFHYILFLLTYLRN